MDALQISELLPFGDKAIESMFNCGFLTVWEGAVRSAKTIVSTEAFLLHVLKSRDKRHLMIGKSQDAILNNAIDGEFGLIALSGGLAELRRDIKNTSYVWLPGKRIDMFGGENVSSFRAFRGRSYGSVYVDEANLQHPNTIAECFNRTIAAKDRAHFFTLNPDAPNHWLYRDYIDKFRDEKTPGYRWFHFTLDDNPAITEARKAELKSQYIGFNYRRYILGERARAEGQCFASFVRNKRGEIGNVLYDYPENIRRITFGIDFGGNKSATAFVCTGWFLKDRKPCIVALDHKRIKHDGGKIGPRELERMWFEFQANCRARWPADRAFADSAEQVLIKGLNQIPQSIHVENAMKRPIMERIRAANMLYAQGRAFVMSTCPGLIDAIENAVYDDSKDIDERLDDGSSDIDSLDADEYSWERDISQLLEGVNA